MRAVLMPVPKAAMHKDDSAAFRQHNVRLSGQILAVEPETISELMQERADLSFRRCVGRMDATHDVASFFRREGVQGSITLQFSNWGRFRIPR